MSDDQADQSAPTTIPISFELDLSKHLGRWEAPNGIGPEGEGATFEPLTIEDVVIRTAAHIVASGIDAEARQKVAARMAELVATTRSDVVREIVEAEVWRQMEEPFTPMDRFGHATGEPTTLAAEVSAMVAKALTEQITEPGGRGSYDSPKNTVVGWAVAKAVKGEVTKQVTAAVAEARDQVIATVSDVAGAEISKAVKAALR